MSNQKKRELDGSSTEPGTTNLRINPIEPLPPDAIRNTEPDAMLDELMTLADFKIPFSEVDLDDPIDSILENTKSKTWQEMEKDRHLEHQEDIQQRYFYSNQPKSTEDVQHRYPTRSKTSVNEAKATAKDKEFVFLREKGEKKPVFK